MPKRAGLIATQTRDAYYDYDAMGLQAKARFDGLSGEGVTSAYDGFGRLASSTTNMGGTSRTLSFAYAADGTRTGLTHPDGAAFAYYYDALGRVTALLDNPAATSLDDYVVRYWYNAAGSRSGIVRGAGAGGFTTVYYRDPIERPTTIANDLPGTANDAPIELAYNAASQIVSRTVSNNAYAAPPDVNRSLAYQVNGLNQYTAASNRTYSYDLNGNLIGDGTTNYVYDVENRLVSASGATNASLAYDPLGRLFQVSSAATGTTQFLHDGDRLVAEHNGSGALLRRYVHGPGADDPVAVYDGPALGLANRRYMLPDERGSVSALVNADGTLWEAIAGDRVTQGATSRSLSAMIGPGRSPARPLICPAVLASRTESSLELPPSLELAGRPCRVELGGGGGPVGRGHSARDGRDERGGGLRRGGRTDDAVGPDRRPPGGRHHPRLLHPVRSARHRRRTPRPRGGRRLRAVRERAGLRAAPLCPAAGRAAPDFPAAAQPGPLCGRVGSTTLSRAGLAAARDRPGPSRDPRRSAGAERCGLPTPSPR